MKIITLTVKIQFNADKDVTEAELTDTIEELNKVFDNMECDFIPEITELISYTVE